MNQFITTTVSYNGKEVSGLALPVSVQRLTHINIPNGYVSIGKQRYNDGLRICFIEETFIKKLVPKTLRQGEYSISNYTTNLEIQELMNHASNVVKECFLKDPSDKHKMWMKRTLENNMGLNNWDTIAQDILDENWNDNPAVITLDFNTYFNKS